MKKSTKFILANATLGLLVLIGYLACQKEVRFVGSKPSPSTTLDSTIAGNPFVMNKLAFGICQIVNRCHPQVAIDHCLIEISNTKGFAARFGLSDQFDTLSKIITAESSGVLVGSSTNADRCAQEIESLSCQNALVQSAYDASLTQAFAGTVNLVSGNNCAQTLTPVLKYTCAKQIFLRSGNNPSIQPFDSGTADIFTSYSIEPSLPPGLNLNPATGVISGVPTSLSELSNFVITAKSTIRTAMTTVAIQSADGFSVNDLSDSKNIGGSKCQTSSGTCTLRAALEAAKTSGQKQIILVPAGTIQLSSSPLEINSAVEIYGDCQQGTILDGMQKTQVMAIKAGPTYLEHLTIQNGSTTDSMGSGLLIFANAGTFSTTLKNLIVKNNKNIGGASGMANGTGIGVYGKDSTSRAIVNLSDCSIVDNINEGGSGGGIGLWYNTKLDIRNCTFTGNQSSGNGAGISSHSGDVTITGALFTRNLAKGLGGGIFTDQYASENSKLENVTFAENQAEAGGGIYFGAQNATVNNATFFKNNSKSAWYGGAIAGMASKITILNSIFSENRSNGVLAQCKGSGALPVVSGGNNLSDGAANDCNFSAATDIVNINPLLGTLIYNGGNQLSNLTMAPLPTSRAIGSGNPLTCAQTDQRQVLRLTDQKCDIGAFESSY